MISGSLIWDPWPWIRDIGFVILGFLVGAISRSRSFDLLGTILESRSGDRSYEAVKKSRSGDRSHKEDDSEDENDDDREIVRPLM
jgi:hypothetical protein